MDVEVPHVGASTEVSRYRRTFHMRSHLEEKMLLATNKLPMVARASDF